MADDDDDISKEVATRSVGLAPFWPSQSLEMKSKEDQLLGQTYQKSDIGKVKIHGKCVKNLTRKCSSS